MLGVCATPIGNLEDVTLRVLRELCKADVILCEDTRRTRVLLERHEIRGRLLSYHEHNEAKRTAELLPRLVAGERMALVTDAGMPGISDPGARLIGAALDAGVPVTVLPGASAVETALVASGLLGERYSSSATCRAERALAALWKELSRWPWPVVAFESPQRLPRTLRSLADAMPERPVAVCRELTKAFEEVARGTAAELATRFAEPPKGEIVLVARGLRSGRRRSGRCRRGRRAGRRRRAATAGGGRRRTTDGRVPERALRRVPVSHVTTSAAFATVPASFTSWTTSGAWRGSSVSRLSSRFLCARRSGRGAGMDVAGRGACPAPLRVRSLSAGAPGSAPRDRRRRSGRYGGRLADGRRRHVRRNPAGQRTDAQHSDAGRLQRHPHASRVARGASRRKREEEAIVARVGASGPPEVDVPYLHLGIRLASDEDGYLDPLSFLPPRPAASPPAPPAPPATVSTPAAEPPPDVAQPSAAGGVPTQEQPVPVQAAPAPPSSSGPPSSPAAGPPSAQPDEPVEPELPSASSHPTIGTPDLGAGNHHQSPRHFTRAQAEHRAIVDLGRGPASGSSRSKLRSRAGRAAHAPLVADPQLGARTSILQMPHASETVRATATAPVALLGSAFAPRDAGRRA